MNFVEAVKSAFQRYFDFTSRSSRSEFWWFMLFGWLLQLVFGLIGLDILAALAALAILIPSIAVGVRRLHDIDRSGWWYLLTFIPIIGWIVLIYWFVQLGTVGDNRFGTDPLAGMHSEVQV